VNEVVSLVPDFMYGIAIAWLFAVLAETRGRGLGTALTAAIAVWAISVVPTYLGIANSALLPAGLAVATTLVGLFSAVPTAWLVWKGLHRQVPSSG
jgi:GNAT superfamily N-acetyltransferase